MPSKARNPLFLLPLFTLISFASLPILGQQITTNEQSFTATPFTGINLCAPINLLIAPNASQGYSFTTEGESSAINNIQATFNSTNGLLFITTTGPISTNQTIKMTVTLPAANLTIINHDGPSATIYVASGFSPPVLNVSTGFGAGQLYINNVTTNALSLDISGIGPVIVTGSLGSVTATSNSINGLYLSGVQSTAQLNLTSTANAYINTASSSTTITGTATGLNTVQYTAGTCSLSSSVSAISGISFPNCLQVAFLSIPPPTPTWTCGIVMQGNFTCQPGTVLSSSTAGSVLSTSGGGPSLTTTVPGGFVSQGSLGPGSSQFQSGMAVPGAASAQAGIVTTGQPSSSSSSASASSTSSSISTTSGGTTTTTPPGGTSFSSTQTTLNGVSQGFVTSSGGTSTPGVVISYGLNNTAQATAMACVAPLESIRIPLSGGV